MPHKVCNRNTVTVSNSCIENIGIIIKVHKIRLSNPTLRVTVERKMNVKCKEDIERLIHSLNEQFLKNAKKNISWCD